MIKRLAQTFLIGKLIGRGRRTAATRRRTRGRGAPARRGLGGMLTRMLRTRT